MAVKAPFKFLDSYTKKDKEIFFGRETEIEELYAKVFQSKLLLVYGASGTGKSSVINCGLANKFQDSDWLPIHIRKGEDINQSLLNQLLRETIHTIRARNADADAQVIEQEISKALDEVRADRS